MRSARRESCAIRFQMSVEHEERIKKALGPTWCFAHNEPLPCGECAAMPEFIGRCFDCKRELTTVGEAGERCSCGSTVRAQNLYQYP